jgi:hypothetical protein
MWGGAAVARHVFIRLFFSFKFLRCVQYMENFTIIIIVSVYSVAAKQLMLPYLSPFVVLVIIFVLLTRLLSRAMRGGLFSWALRHAVNYSRTHPLVHGLTRLIGDRKVPKGLPHLDVVGKNVVQVFSSNNYLKHRADIR